jgi:hypothetical protein
LVHGWLYLGITGSTKPQAHGRRQHPACHIILHEPGLLHHIMMEDYKDNQKQGK